MRLLSSSAIIVLLLLSATANAGTSGDHARARELFRQAQQHYKLAEYTEALEGFKETYRILEDATLLFNIAQCYRQLNKKEEAIRFYRTYLHEVGNVPDRQSVEDTIASLDKQLKQEQAARDKAKPKIDQPQGAPPPATTAPAATTAAPSHVAAPESRTRAERTPAYKRWWPWTLVGVVVAAGVGVGLGLGLTRTPPPPSAPTQDGTFKPFSISVAF
jgi:tetratricopeptide (TPR) repeat protein